MTASNEYRWWKDRGLSDDEAVTEARRVITQTSERLEGVIYDILDVNEDADTECVFGGIILALINQAAFNFYCREVMRAAVGVDLEGDFLRTAEVVWDDFLKALPGESRE